MLWWMMLCCILVLPVIMIVNLSLYSCFRLKWTGWLVQGVSVLLWSAVYGQSEIYLVPAGFLLFLCSF